MIKYKKGVRLRRICKRCNKYFIPTGRFQAYCLSCREFLIHGNKKKI